MVINNQPNYLANIIFVHIEVLRIEIYSYVMNNIIESNLTKLHFNHITLNKCVHKLPIRQNSKFKRLSLNEITSYF